MCILTIVVSRIQVILPEEEREKLRQVAEREGLSLSAWLRRIGLEKAREAAADDRITTLAELDRFFRSCDRREKSGGAEPDWEEHLAVMERSLAEGRGAR